MKNINLLSKILKKTNDLIMSEEFKVKYKIENSFSRKRKLSFVNSVYFILSGLRKSISTEINNFIEEHSNLNFPKGEVRTGGGSTCTRKAFRASFFRFPPVIFTPTTELSAERIMNQPFG